MFTPVLLPVLACGYYPRMDPADSMETIAKCYSVLLLEGQCNDCFERPLAFRMQINRDVIGWAERTLILVFPVAGRRHTENRVNTF